ncbi:MAG: response regulator [Vulcanimicrobiota bacterium]
MLRVLIADDHPVMRRGIGHVLMETVDKVETDEASKGYEVIERISKQCYDVVLLDITMPDMNGIDVMKQIRICHPDLPVLILSIHREDLYAVRALRAGASGYLTKECASEELGLAIRTILSGSKYINSSLAQKLASELDTSSHQKLHKKLSDRELQVMQLIASGKTVKDAAEEMSLSVKTISTYRSRILEKLNLRNNAEITYYALKEELVV